MLDRIKQTTTTTGTGAYTLSAAAVDGFRTMFAAFAAEGTFGEAVAVVPYLVTMGAEWEAGYGTYDEGNPGTLSRTFVTSSSNSNNAVNWGAGEKEISVAPNAWSGGVLGARNKWTVFNAPSVTDDNTLGFAPGSMWKDGGKLWVCVDAATGAAVWARVRNASWNSVYDGAAYLKLDDGDAAYPRTDLGHQVLAGLGTFSDRRPRMATLGFGLATSDATPGGPIVQVGRAAALTVAGAAILRGTAVVIGETTNDSAMWTFVVACRSAPGSPFALEIVGTPAITLVYADAALSTADFDVVLASGAGHTLQLQATGVAATQLRWSFEVRINEVFQVA